MNLYRKQDNMRRNGRFSDVVYSARSTQNAGLCTECRNFVQAVNTS